MNATTSKTTLVNEAATLFACKVERVPNLLHALGFREPCSRCGGSGRYSFNQVDGDRCYGCAGKRFVAVKLTAQVLADARAKIEAGELVRLREEAARKAAAKKSIGGLVAAARDVYATIGDAYTAFGKEHDAHTTVHSPIFLAQGMNNAIFFDYIGGIRMDVDFGKRRDYERCAAEIVEATEMLAALRQAWEGRTV